MNHIFKKWHSSNLKDDIKYEHPTAVYETENMNSVFLPKVSTEININRKLKISNFITEYITDVQYEAILYAVYSLTNSFYKEIGSNGFLLGDGTGVGKTRTLASIISILFEKKRDDFRCIWVSTNKLLEKNVQTELKVMDQNDNKIPKILKINKLEEEPGFLYTTYSSLIREKNYDKVVNWLKKSTNRNILIIFDEAHMAKNNNSLIGKRVVQLQNEIDGIGVIYSTATAASEVRQLHYMTKLGLWRDSHHNFVKRLESYGSSAMELVSLQLKMDGRLVSRHLGFDNIKIDILQCYLTTSERNFYDKISELWRINAFEQSTGLDHLSIYRYLITSFKVRHAICLIKQTLEKGDSVVIGVQNTGEVASKRDEYSNISDKLKQYNIDVSDIDFQLNPIDSIINVFGEDDVVEISGRSSRLIIDNNGQMIRKSVPDINSEIALFQSNSKRIAIVTRTGSSGISLHSENHISGENRRRHHIILETPWSAESLMQQIGRTHRTNSIYPPYYTFLVTDIPSEFRFFNGLAKKFENLGALTKGDKRASILSKLNFDGCESITTKNYKNFHFEFNLQIGREWCRKFSHIDDTDIDYSNILQGLKLYIREYGSNNIKIKNMINLVLKKLNIIAIDVYENIQHFDLTNPKKNSIQWKYIWINISGGRINFSLNDKSLYVLYSTCWTYLETYCKQTSRLFKDTITEWKNEHLKYKDVRETMNMLMLCRIKPECSNTLGLLPKEVILGIVPWILKRNDMSRIDWKGLYKTEKINIPRQIYATDSNTFFNNFFNFPILYQKQIYQSFRDNLKNEQEKRDNIKTLREYIIGNTNDYKFDILDINQYNDYVEFKLRVVLGVNLEEHIKMYEDWINKKRVLSFIQDKKNKVKFGLLLSSNNPNWENEIWFPGSTTPALCFNKCQWEFKNHMYNLKNIDDNEWKMALTKQIGISKIKADKLSCMLKIAKKNAINHWDHSTGELIKINIPGLIPFIGLIIKKKLF